MTGHFLTKPNQESNLEIFEDLIMRVMTQTEPKNGKQVNRMKKETNKCKMEYGKK